VTFSTNAPRPKRSGEPGVYREGERHIGKMDPGSARATHARPVSV